MKLYAATIALTLTDRKFKRHFHPAATTARLWPAGAGGRCSRAALAAPPARSQTLPRRRAARRGAAARGRDSPPRLGAVSASGVLRGRGPWDGRFGKSGGIFDLVSDWLVDLSIQEGLHLHVIPLPAPREARAKDSSPLADPSERTPFLTSCDAPPARVMSCTNVLPGEQVVQQDCAGGNQLTGEKFPPMRKVSTYCACAVGRSSDIVLICTVIAFLCCSFLLRRSPYVSAQRHAPQQSAAKVA
jgi:hypothetical protein